MPAAELVSIGCSVAFSVTCFSFAATLAKHALLTGDDITVADAYLITVLGWMPVFSIDISPWPNVVDYVERIAARPSVTAAREQEAEIPMIT